jgi:hypothetical protein
VAKLTTKARKDLPAGKFAGPDRSYPVENKSHARDAKARASEEEHKGRISPGEEKRIDAKANKVLGKGRESHRPDKSRPKGWGTAK